MNSPDTVVVGIDGATYDLIDPWMEAGKLPNLKRFLENGVRSDLRTTYPPLTGPAWVSFMTGSNPGRHGVYDFLTGDTGSEEVINYDSIEQVTLWEAFSSENISQGLVNVPVTFPPPAVDNGHILSGPLSSSDPDEASHPDGFVQKLEEKTGREWWHRSSSGFTPSKPLQYFESHLRDNETMAEYTLHMLDEYEYDFFMVLFDLVDSISHFFWHYMDEDHPYHEDRGEDYKNAILKAYQMVDGFLGRLDENLGSETDLVLMSDHGFGPIEYMVNLNNFFRDQGLLKMKNSPTTNLKKALRFVGITPKRLVKIAETVGLDFLAFMLPKSVRNKIIGAMGSFGDVDWEESICYSRGHMGQVHIVDRLKTSEGDYREARKRVADTLRKDLIEPGTDEPIVSNLHFREELYEGPYLDSAPDIFVEMKDFRCIAYPLFSSGSDLFIRHIQEGRYANHRMNGMFGGRGPSFREGIDLGGASIVDLAPTLMYLQGIPVHETMDGEILREALKPELLEKRSPEYKNYRSNDHGDTGSGDDSAQEDAKDRLKGLGYLG